MSFATVRHFSSNAAGIILITVFAYAVMQIHGKSMVNRELAVKYKLVIVSLRQDK
jgi:hypothetical protein